MKSLLAAALFAGSTIGCAGTANTDQRDIAPAIGQSTSQIEKTADALAASYDFSGVALVAAGDEVLLNKGYGFAQIESRQPNTPQTQFRIASLSKTFTAVMVLQLVEEGKIDLDATIADLLPEYEAEYAGEVTVRQLLTHRSGIPHYIDLPGWFDGAFAETNDRDEFFGKIADLPLNFAPGTSSRYSNANYYLLGMLVERATGSSYAEALQARIVGPLELGSTGHMTDAIVLPNLAQNYIPGDEEGYVKGGALNNFLFTATASLYSSSSDLLRWTASFSKPELLSPESLALMLNPDDPIGWSVLGRTADADIVWSYNGEIEGYTSFILLDPASQTTVIVLDNKSAGYETVQRMSVELLTAVLSDDTE